MPLERLVEIMRRLRDPVSGCEWDTVQTFDTIAPYTIEEAYEVADHDDLNVLGMNFLSSLSRWGVEGRWLVLVS
jgi:hypothetical protein